MATKALKGFREVPKQDGSGKLRLERVPYFGAKNASAKIRQKKSRKVRPVTGGFAALFSPVKSKGE